MTQKDKDLLLKDICSRLPYGIIIKHEGNLSKLDTIFMCDSISISSTSIDKKLVYNLDLDEIKPYLFPLSSMTEEQKYDLYCRFIETDCDFDDFKEFYLDNGMWHQLHTSLDDIEAIIDWFNKNHFDYRGLIEKSLALDATGLNIY